MVRAPRRAATRRHCSIPALAAPVAEHRAACTLPGGFGKAIRARMPAMSRQTAHAFLAKLESDEQLQSEVLALQQEQADGVKLSTRMLAERAARSGYSFSAKELYDACLERAATDARSELPDADLDRVTGGSKNEVAIETLQIVHEGFGDGSAAGAAVQTLCLAPGARRPKNC